MCNYPLRYFSIVKSRIYLSEAMCGATVNRSA